MPAPARMDRITREVAMKWLLGLFALVAAVRPASAYYVYVDSYIGVPTLTVNTGGYQDATTSASVAPRPTRMGAMSWVSEPMNTSSSMMVRCLLAPS